MNTINNKIAIPDNKENLPIEKVIQKAKDAGYSMIVIGGYVYSIQLFYNTQQTNEYFIENYALFAFEEIQPKEPETVKFHKSFEALYAVSMAMADNCIGAKAIEKRFEKLEEEYQELIVEFSKLRPILKEDFDLKKWENQLQEIKGEFGDVLFVLLHIIHKFGYSPFELLHAASSKMLARMNDSKYVAKN